MRLPNGYGSVYKLSGRRRKPWAARKTVGWHTDDSAGTVYPVYYFVGYYATKAEALAALAEFNKDPEYMSRGLTLGELHDRWSRSHYPRLSKHSIDANEAAWKIAAPLRDRRVSELRLDDFQMLFDNSGKNRPTLTRLKSVLSLMYDYAVRNELIQSTKTNAVRYIDLSASENPDRHRREPFSREELAELWAHEKEDTGVRTALILIYTGLRIGEFLSLTVRDVHLSERYIDIRQSKTQAGVRRVPIADRVLPLIRALRSGDDLTDDSALLRHSDGTPYNYAAYLNHMWMPAMSLAGIASHRPHDTRHTCVTLLTEAGTDPRVIKAIVGHSGSGVTELVYTHIDLQTMLDAVNRI